MTAREYLLQIRSLEGTVRRHEADISRRKALGADPREIIGLEAKQKTRKRALLQLREVITDQVSALPREAYADLLFFVYVRGYDLRHAARSMQYSYDRVRHIHTEALQAFEEMYAAELKKRRKG